MRQNEQISKGNETVIMTPEHIKSHKAPNLHLTVQCGWRFSEFYKWIRDSNNAIADGSPKKWSGFEQLDVQGMYRFGMEGHTQWDAPNCWGLAPFIQIRRNMDENPDYMFQYEVVLYVDTGNDDITLPVGIHWQVAYAVLEKSEPIKWDIRHVTITFYDTHDNPIVSLSSDVDMRCKAGKYIIDPEFSAKKKQRVDGGCLFCDKAVYQKEGGIVYIACTKYDGRVKEVEYTGEAYPEYCKRRA